MASVNLISKRTMATVKSAKSALRKEIQSAIEKLDDAEKNRQSEKVVEKLLNLPQYKESKRISVYLSTDNEINTLPILKEIFKNGKEVFVPRYLGKSMSMVKLHSLEDYEKLPLTKWNIKQPSSRDEREDALNTGKRLGHGMGYYDKFLTMCMAKQKEKPHLVAVAFNEQIRNDVPTTEMDVLLDAVITEKSFI